MLRSAGQIAKQRLLQPRAHPASPSFSAVPGSVAHSGKAVIGRHDNQFPFGGHLEEQIGMLGAQFGERFIRYRPCRENRGKIRLIDQERDGSILAPSDPGEDITVLREAHA